LNEIKIRKKLGEKIQKLRINKGYSQEEVAKFLHIPRPSVSQIEHGKRDISVIELAKLSEIFNLSPNELVQVVDKEKPPKQKSSQQKNIQKIYFIRHGEAVDDILNQYGGWANPELTSKGISRAYDAAKELNSRKLNLEIVFSSPLNRAYQKAEILGQEMDVECKILQYLKERNTYGILCGINKDVAKQKYPDLVKAYKNEEYVLGSERYEDFVDRIELLFNYLETSSYNNIAAITHGKLISAIAKEYLDMKPDKLEDGCMLVVGIEDNEKYYIQSEGILFTK
jgi:broad specificity phosphatase PhoE/predicted XRE-type DNA-binding protein